MVFTIFLMTGIFDNAIMIILTMKKLNLLDYYLPSFFEFEKKTEELADRPCETQDDFKLFLYNAIRTNHGSLDETIEKNCDSEVKFYFKTMKKASIQFIADLKRKEELKHADFELDYEYDDEYDYDPNYYEYNPEFEIET